MHGFTSDMMGSGLSALAAANIAGTSLLGQTALGSTQTTAFAVTTPTVEFSTVALNTGALLPAPGGRVNVNDGVFMVNNGANPLSVYPPVGFKIALGVTNAAFSVPSGKAAWFQSRGDGNYFALVSA